MNACRHCGREGRFYRAEPEDYGAWQEWADRMVRTHHQERCPGCGRYSVWRKGAPAPEENE
jgi:ribosomal protein S14